MLTAAPRLALAGALLAAATWEAAAQPARACYVRAAEDDPTVLSHIGIRRSRAQLFDVDIRVALPGGASCSVSGVARIRGTPGQEMLAFPLRSDLTAPRPPNDTPCQVFVQLTPTALVLALPEGACQATPPCDGLIELHGQRFDLGGKVPDDARGPCFATPAAFGTR